ncbi:MAG: family 78 glycoside hydrolase catalytic domain [Bacteroidales bacterium]|nr:family 78 glycoside hydrolase catalytic domain [Bacteroidales bacterium]
MKKKLPLSLALFTLCLVLPAQAVITGLLTENMTDPIGIDTDNPRFSWLLLTDKRNVSQTAFELRVSDGTKNVWNTGKVSSDQSVHFPYAGESLKSGTYYTWQVRVWDNSGKRSAWSLPAKFQTGLTDSTGWVAKWIEPGYAEDTVMRPSPLMRKEFTLKGKVARATAYITAHGLYEAELNGTRIGDAFLTPGWTSYGKRLQYQAYDVTTLLKNGRNAVGVMLGSGWYRGNIGFRNSISFYGRDIALLCQVDITYSDGSTERIISDGSWKSSTGAVRYSEIYHGEIYDARLEKKGWTLPGYDDAAWDGVKVALHDMDVLIATRNEPVKKHETFAPVKILQTPEGDQVIDFGQNLVGWVQMKVTGNVGDSVILSHAEVLDRKGNFYTANLRAAKAQDTYVLKGGGEEFFEPHFTWHGFRYLKVEGYPGKIRPEDFTAVAIYSAMKPTGSFITSDSLINRLQHNIQWGQKGNFLDVPTDCPQRDERLGWTGDAQAFSRTAAFNMNVNSFFAKWLKDVEADQIEGKVPYVVPNVLGPGSVNSTGWSDVATIAPWNMYLVYGDRQLLEQQYGSMKAYVESIRNMTRDDLWNSGFHYGDWLFYRPDDDNSGMAAVTDKYLIAQCFYAHSVQLLINAANVLGKTDDAASYSKLLGRIKDAFIKEYVTPGGRLVSGTQTAYVLALNFDMLPEGLREQAADRLVANVKSYGHLTTGFLGTPYLCHVLSRFGHTDLAYDLLLRKKYPSWLYPVTMGATTIWERWDGQKPDGTFQTPGMNSFNHYAYGAIGDWMYRVVAGLDTRVEWAGYKQSIIKPHIGGGLTHVSASLDTYYGKLSSSWKVNGDKLVMDVEIPANTTATVFIPSDDPEAILEGGRPLTQVKEIQVVGTEDGYFVVKLGSGRYSFSRGE